jgi:DNA-binding MarR family transcriptional regulator
MPWSDDLSAGTERQQLESAFMLAVRKAGAIMQLLGSAAAERVGINTTDLMCLNILTLSGTLTAGELARATGLTTASITGVIDRLESSGFVRRDRDPSDRRRVVIQPVADRVIRDVAPVFVPVVHAWHAAMSNYTDEELKLILDFQHRSEHVLRDNLTALRTAPEET